jgi:hypothetical protein
MLFGLMERIEILGRLTNVVYISTPAAQSICLKMEIRDQMRKYSILMDLGI